MFDKAALHNISTVARAFKLDPRALAAVAWVESAGTPFWNIGGANLPAIRWEGHYFFKRLSGDKLKQAVSQGLASAKAGKVPNPKSWEGRYKLLSRAMDIDAEAALESISMGLGQVMGAHWRSLGYSSVQAMWADAKSGIDGQVRLMARFIDNNKLSDALNNKQWAKFAARYNGPNYKVNRYDIKMAEAYRMVPQDNSPAAQAEAIKEASRPNIDSKWVQASLQTLGYYEGKIDGIIGRDTKLGIKLFQRDHGLVDDGIAGSLTRDEIADALQTKTQKKAVSNLPQTVGLLAGGGSAITTITSALTDATTAGTSARGMLENIGISNVLVTIGVAVVTGLVIWWTIKSLRENREA